MTRLILEQEQSNPEPRTVSHNSLNNKAFVSGWLLLGLLSLIFLIWLVFRWSFDSSIFNRLPAFAVELIELAELATLITLVLVWLGLLLHTRRKKRGTTRFLNLDQLYNLSPKAFEHYVASLFRLKGYRVIVRGRSGDHGVDLEVRAKDGKRAIVQCKRYQNTVGEEVVRDLFGTLIHERVDRAFLVTTAEISEAAHEWAAGKPITLIDGPTLVQIAERLVGKLEPA